MDNLPITHRNLLKQYLLILLKEKSDSALQNQKLVTTINEYIDFYNSYSIDTTSKQGADFFVETFRTIEEVFVVLKDEKINREVINKRL